MIAKISKSGSSFYGAALYNQKKVDKKEGKILASQNILGTKPRQLQSFLSQVSKVSNTKKPVFHVSLSFSEKDTSKLNDAQLVAISKDYLKEMGYEKQAYIIYRHDDTKHPHVHILSTRVDINTAKKINDSYEGRRSKTITDQLENKYDLVIANHQTKEHKSIKNDLKEALKNAPTSIAQLNKSLGKEGSNIRAKSLGRGLIYYKIGTEKDIEKRKSKTWKSSDFKSEGLDKKGLEKEFNNNYQDRKHIKSAVQSTLKGGQKMTLTAFEEALAKRQIVPIYAQNEKGIYGLSYAYKDKQFKASDLGKGHSWNQIKDQLVDAKPNSLRENLTESIVQGEPIEVWQEGKKLVFESSNLQLQAQLNDLPEEQAKDLVRLHNNYQDRIYEDPLLNDRALVKDLAGDDIDEYLQRQYKYREQEMKRRIK